MTSVDDVIKHIQILLVGNVADKLAPSMKMQASVAFPCNE